MARNRGRHRAPSTLGDTARRTVARTALAGAVVGSPLALAAPAHAASDATWDRLAQCESSGRWNINTGNGYSGGLQFHPRTWLAFGGGQFAPIAAQATREEQIVVAERVLAVQGWRAWPACSRKLGLKEPATPRPAPPKAPRAKAPAPPPAPPAAGEYVVQAGDTLAGIAKKVGIAGGWRALVALNPALGANPNLIVPGQRIRCA